MKCNINGNEYDFYKNYQNQDALRGSLNELAQETFGGLTFEPWYEQGYWTEKCVPYALFDHGICAANMFANRFELMLDGVKKQYIQLGTVMTRREYRKKGLSRFLMERIMEEWADSCDLLYLYANDSVVDFYPRFGFKEQNEYQYRKYTDKKDGTIRKLSLDNAEDKKILLEKIGLPNPFAEIQMQHCTEILMFHCIMFQNDNLYYLPDYDAVVIAEYSDHSVFCYDIFCERTNGFDEITAIISNADHGTVTFGFTPKEEYGCEAALFRDQDTRLFVLEGKDNIFEYRKRMLPVLCHT